MTIKINRIRYQTLSILGIISLLWGGSVLAQEVAVPNKTPTPPVSWDKQWLRLSQNSDLPPTDIDLIKGISTGGLVMVDAEHQTAQDFNAYDGNQIEVSAASIQVKGEIGSWVQANINLFYSTDSERYYPVLDHRHGVTITQGNIRIANFEKCPAYLSIGEQYLPFGRYTQYPLIPPLTTRLTEARSPALEIGWIQKNGFYGTLYGFQGESHPSRLINNYGAMVGYADLRNPLGFDIGLGYLYDMKDVGDINASLSNPHDTSSRVDAMSLNADILSGPFDLLIRYVTALGSFDPADLSFQKSPTQIKGAKPQAGSIKAGYLFKLGKHENKMAVGYEWSREALNLNQQDTFQFPRDRITVSYGISLCKYVILEAETGCDRDYSESHGGTHRTNYLGLLRGMMVF